MEEESSLKKGFLLKRRVRVHGEGRKGIYLSFKMGGRREKLDN